MMLIRKFLIEKSGFNLYMQIPAGIPVIYTNICLTLKLFCVFLYRSGAKWSKVVNFSFCIIPKTVKIHYIFHSEFLYKEFLQK